MTERIRAWAAMEPGGKLRPFEYEPGPLRPDEVEIAVQRSVSGSPVGDPATIATMLDFCARHGIAPTVERFPMSRVNEALDHLRSGRARYRIVLEADFTG